MTQPEPSTETTTSAADVGTPKKAAAASLIGSALEWYDFFLYGTAAALVIGPLFFGSGDGSLTGTLQAFATFAIGFAARPIGGVIFGHFGDRLGRKKMLVITLLLMGLGTALIGALPTYEQIGALAPILLVLLRLVQSVAVGGEFGGAVLLISEHSRERRGFFTSFSQVGIMLGFVMSAGVFALFKQLPRDAFMTWGWRVPFALGLLLMVVGLIIRMKVEETPEFQRLQRNKTTLRFPVWQVLRTQPKRIVIASGARMAENGGSYFFLVFSITYGTFVGVDATVLLIAAIVANVIEMGTIVLFGALSDNIGRRPVYLIGSIGAILWAFPFFALIQTGGTINVFVAIIVAVGLCHGAMIGSQPAFFSELFKGEMRYSGLAIGHEIAAIVAGGVAPLIATALLAKYNAYWPIAIYLGLLGVITTVAVIVAPETMSRNRSVGKGQESNPQVVESS